MKSLTRIYFCCFYLALGVLIQSCSTDPQPIDYRGDQCDACKMMIADQRFGTELVTTKGKIYKYDAIECMLPVLLQKGSDKYQHILVTGFNHPEKLINAKTSTYLISEERPSPMGGNLSAYATAEDGLSAQQQVKGKHMSWDELLQHYEEKRKK